MIYWIPALVWMGVIFFLSGRTGGELHSLFPFVEHFNPGHVVAYYILALLYYFALSKNRHHRAYLKAFMFCLLYGITDEAHQLFVPTRHPDVFDLTRDLFGTTLALGTIFLARKNCPKRLPKRKLKPLK